MVMTRKTISVSIVFRRKNLEIGEKVVIYRKEKNEINVARSIIIRESIYKKLEDMREKYGISISKLVNIAIRTGLEKYKKYN